LAEIISALAGKAKAMPAAHVATPAIQSRMCDPFNEALREGSSMALPGLKSLRPQPITAFCANF
jgi:hypothetical protein